MDALRVGVERGDYPEAVGREAAWLAARAAQLGSPGHRQEQQLSDGSWLLIEDRRTADGGMLGLRVDITEMKQQALALERAAAEAEAANRAKSEFLANISHEIRTPLHGILGLAEVLADDGLTETQRAKVAVIQQSGDLLLGLLNDMLDLAKIEAGKVELDAVEFCAISLVETTCATYRATAAGKGVGLEVVIDDALAGVWRGDQHRLRQVVANLVSNAVKFTDSGAVVVTAERDDEGLRLTVQDTGIGIAPDRLDQLFQKFVQAEASSTRRFGGTGLGLAISRQLAELMGGEITVASRPGVGSTFCLRIPLEAVAIDGRLPEARSSSLRPRGGVRILAAEDNATNQLILRSLLQPLEVDLTLVGNGREAIEAFTAGAFDLVLMDIQMPETDGLTAARAIRAIERQRRWRPTPILALSANAMAHQVAEYRAAGMNDTLSKPFRADRLYALLATYLDAEEELPAARVG
jgi:signal transduction histidine kinase/ActR/RegA family two-component response regulator